MRLLHNSEDVELDCLVSNFIFNDTFDFIVYLSNRGKHHKVDVQQMNNRVLLYICYKLEYSFKFGEYLYERAI